jgi:hypothetical protein
VRRAASVIVITAVGFLLWLHYGWLWNCRPWNSTPESVPPPTFGDAWEWESRHLGSPVAKDCGRVKVEESSKNATECGLKAFRKRQPFRVRYEIPASDTYVSAGLIYTPEGTLYGLTIVADPQYDGTPSPRHWIETTLCPSPFQLHVTANARLTCFSKETVPPPNIMADL